MLILRLTVVRCVHGTEEKETLKHIDYPIQMPLTKTYMCTLSKCCLVDLSVQ